MDIIENNGHHWTLWTSLKIMDTIRHYGQNQTLWSELDIMDIIFNFGFWTLLDRIRTEFQNDQAIVKKKS